MATNQGLGHLGLINWAMNPLDKEVLQLMQEAYTAGIESKLRVSKESEGNDYGLGQVTMVGSGGKVSKSLSTYPVSFTLSTQEPYVCERIGDALNEDDNECYPYVIATIKYRGKDKEWWKKRLVELEPKEKRWGGGEGQYGYPAAAAAAAESSLYDEIIEKLKRERGPPIFQYPQRQIRIFIVATSPSVGNIVPNKETTVYPCVFHIRRQRILRLSKVVVVRPCYGYVVVAHHKIFHTTKNRSTRNFGFDITIHPMKGIQIVV